MYATEPFSVRGVRSDGPDGRVAGVRISGSSKCIWFDDHFERRHWLDIGRVCQRSIRLRNPTVSRYHCAIERTPDGDEYQIVDRGSANGVFVASHGRYSEFRKVTAATLRLGMRIMVGSVLLAPVNAEGVCPSVVARYSELTREIVTLYGSSHALHSRGGLPRKVIKRMMGADEEDA